MQNCIKRDIEAINLGIIHDLHSPTFDLVSVKHSCLGNTPKWT